MRIRDALSGAVKNIGHHKAGVCNVCARPTVFVCTDKNTVRNNMLCLFCRTSSRQRHVAQVVVERVAPDAGSVKNIPRASDIRIYNTDCTGGFARQLSHYEGALASGLFPGKEAGEELSPRVFNQDLEKLTFGDELFGVVVSEDVFEHVRRHEDGFREVWRVLKPGGYHVFTVPFRFDRPTLTRVDTRGDQDVHLLPAEYHGDSIRGKILAYRTFGIDMFEQLREIGFDTEVVWSDYGDRHHGIYDSYVFVSKKTTAGAGPAA